MKYFFFLLLFPFLLFAQQTYVPDDNFEYALIKLGLDNPPLNDSVPTKNIDTVTILDLMGENISDLTGINDFVSLRAFNCSYNNLNKIELSNLLKLEQLYCPNSWIQDLDISKNKSLRILSCWYNRLTSLDVTNNVALQSLSCPYNYLSALDISHNTKLKLLECDNNLLDSLNISKNNSLEFLTCESNRLTSLVVKDKPNLERLICSNNQLTILELSNVNFLEMFDTRNNPLLTCIQVDDTNYFNRNFNSLKDSIAHYSENCGYTSVNDKTSDDNKIFIFPNPASDFIEINVPRWRGQGVDLKNAISGIRSFDLLGVEVLANSQLSIVNSQLRIDVSSLSPGVYFVCVVDVVRKFVKL